MRHASIVCWTLVNLRLNAVRFGTRLKKRKKKQSVFSTKDDEECFQTANSFNDRKHSNWTICSREKENSLIQSDVVQETTIIINA